MPKKNPPATRFGQLYDALEDYSLIPHTYKGVIEEKIFVTARKSTSDEADCDHCSERTLINWRSKTRYECCCDIHETARNLMEYIVSLYGSSHDELNKKLKDFHNDFVTNCITGTCADTLLKIHESICDSINKHKKCTTPEDRTVANDLQEDIENKIESYFRTLLDEVVKKPLAIPDDTQLHSQPASCDEPTLSAPPIYPAVNIYDSAPSFFNLWILRSILWNLPYRDRHWQEHFLEGLDGRLYPIDANPVFTTQPPESPEELIRVLFHRRISDHLIKEFDLNQLVFHTEEIESKECARIIGGICTAFKTDDNYIQLLSQHCGQLLHDSGNVDILRAQLNFALNAMHQGNHTEATHLATCSYLAGNSPKHFLAVWILYALLGSRFENIIRDNIPGQGEYSGLRYLTADNYD